MQFVKRTVIPPPPSPPSVEKTIEIHKPVFDENKLTDIVRNVVKEQLNANDPASHLEATVQKAMTSGMKNVMDALREKLNSVNVAPSQSGTEVNIDPTKLAEIHQKAVEKVSQEIDVDKIKRGKRIKFKDTSISDLAKEI